MGKVLHASYSGYFPFCLNEYDLDPPSSAYSPVSLETAMRIWWRIKKVRFYGTYVLNPFGTPQTENWGFVAQRNSETEEGLVCNPSANWSIISFEKGTEPGISTNMPVYKYNDNYILGFGFSVRFLDGTEEQGLDYSSISENGDLVYQFEGVTLYNTGFLNDPSATINHEILEYWSYGGTYNTSTGLPL